MEFIGEHLWVGLAGKISIWAALVFALAAMVCYGISCNNKLKTFRMWRFNGRSFFRLHTLAVILAFGFLFHMIFYHYYEYNYVWHYSSNSLGFGYLLASVWAGQEGSFLLWGLFQAIIGVIILTRSKTWEMPVMAIISFSQIFLLASVSGIEIGSLKIGVSPFVLIRDLPENIGSAFFSNTGYLSQITDGMGLNPLLMNFWMKIHPPILFLGFAALIVPFSYALASLVKKDYTAWLKPVLPWASFSALFLGLGLFLGGVWAYEDLTFGGFWAWDPVENSSLVPWLIIVAGIHLIIISKKNHKNLSLTYVVVFLSYIFVLYSSFLTRSGILTATSVHAFAGSGMSGLILVFLIILTILSFGLYFFHFKKFPKPGKDIFFSREFWMFAGAVVILLSAFQIIFSTSLPVINKLFSVNLTLSGTGIEDVKNYYNAWQLPFAVFILITATVSQFLLIGKTPLRHLIKKIMFSFVLSAILSFLLIYFTGHSEFKIAVLIFTSVFSAVAAIDIFFRYDFRFSNKASLLSHFGLGIFVLGIVLAFYGSTNITSSQNKTLMAKRYSDKQFIMLNRNKIIEAKPYYISYSGITQKNNYTFYQIDFLNKNSKGDFYKKFTVTPAILKNNTMGNVNIPGTKHYLTKDIFTYIAHAEITSTDTSDNYKVLDEFEIKIGDTVHSNGFAIALNNLKLNPQKEEISENNVSITASFSLLTPDSIKLTANPVYTISNAIPEYSDAFFGDKKYKIRFEKVSETPKTIVCGLYKAKPDYIIIKTTVFPYIILVWIGAIIMLSGFAVSFIKRNKNAHKVKKDIGIID